MKLKFNLVLMAILLPSLSLWASPEKKMEDRKVIRKAFAVDKNASVEINNKYGKVSINEWSYDSVRFKVTIKSLHKNEDVAEELLDNTLVKFSENRVFVMATTKFEDESSAILGGLSQLSDILTNKGKNSLSIDYEVSVPSTVNLVINNKFGNVYLPNMNGNAKITLSYGDVKLGDYAGYLDVDIEYGDFNAGKLGRINLIAQYSDVVIYEVKNADINSKSSKINIQKADRLRCRSKRDDYTIYQLNSISSNSNYSSYVITELRSNLNITGEYGNITVHSIKKDFDKISINSEHANANLSFDSDCSFQLDIHLEEGDFAYPQNTAKIEEKKGPDDETRIYFGTIGGTANPKSSLEIFGEDTDVNITIK